MKTSDLAACHTGEAKQNKSGIRKKTKKRNVDIDYLIRKNANDLFVQMPKEFTIRSKFRASVRCISHRSENKR